ncbi:hypothetical protein LSTR_LSTR000886 [Laodelphax striatellus]|uniref:DUF4794 domain-containing protein n=1 Tax=Laodelphax striatellus TaxID=195883 RepID=A0A482X0M0_LAOST|nr:hypothetical protein LSTR_LSTR000886 [Laodelphax striatellus]
MRCVLFFCLSVVLGLAAGYPQRHAPQYELPLHLASYNPFLSAADPARRHRDLVDESPESDSFGGQRGFGRPDYGLSDFDTPYSPSFTDMMTQMQEMMVRLRQEMNEILRRLPASGSDDGEGALIPVGDGLDLSNAQNKTTSKTEIIDGQKVTINETVIKGGDDLFGTILRVKTIRVVPHDDIIPDVGHDETTTIKDSIEESDEEVAPVTRNAKNNDNNEIPIEKMQLPYRYAVPDQVEQHVNEIQSNEIATDVVDDETNLDVPDKPRSLSDDTAVNYIAANRKRGSIMMIPSDVELIGVEAPQQNQYYKYDFAADSQRPSLGPVAESMEKFGDVELRDEELP